MRTRRRRVLRRAVVAMTALVALVATSCLDGPIAGTPTVFGIVDPAQIAYQQSEFFVGGYATAYEPIQPLTTDGRWKVREDQDSWGAFFKTRAVVMRPTDPAKFNGTVVVEWMNVSAGLDLPNDWTMTHNEIVRSGAAWVGVSAQTVGVNALKSCCASRYSSLVHPGDSYSYDIFTAAGRELRSSPAMLGGLTPQRLLAVGESQSASRLVTYIDAVHPLVHVYDGFLVHSRGGSGAALAQSPLPAVSVPAPTLIRDDLDVPVFVVQAETDVIGTGANIRQPDTAKFRQWELAGTSHADIYMANVGLTDIGDGQGAIRMFNYMRDPGPPPGTCSSPFNTGPHHWQLQAALHHLEAWVRDGTLPPSGPLLDIASTSPTVLARDAQGNALGGVRSPQVDTPVATITGVSAGSGFCRLYGSTTPLTTTQLAALYSSKADFVAKWTTSLDAAVAGGFILPADRGELLAAAEASTVPN